MSFDALTLKILTLETKDKITNKTIEKVIENREKEFAFIIRDESAQSILYISINPNFPCLFESSNKKFNFTSCPSNFSALLKKYTEGARIVNSFIIHSDRIFIIELLKKDSFCEKKYSLIFEFMGKHSNAILYNGHLSREKAVMQNIVGAYQNSESILDFILNPPKTDIQKLTSDELETLTESFFENKKNFINKYNGFSPKLISLLSGPGDFKDILKIFTLTQYDELINLIKLRTSSRADNDEIRQDRPLLCSFKPGLYAEIKEKKAGAGNKITEQKKYFVYPFDSAHSDNNLKSGLLKEKSGLNEAYCDFFNEYNSRSLIGKISQKINKLLEIALFKESVYRQDFNESKNYETCKTNGQLLLTALYSTSEPSAADSRLEENKNEIEINGEKIKIDCKISISDNAQKYFKNYKRQHSKNLYAAQNLNKYENLINEIHDCKNSLESGNFFEEAEKIIAATEKKITDIARKIFAGKKDFKKFTEEFGSRIKNLKTQLKIKNSGSGPAPVNSANDQTQYYRHFLTEDGLSIFVGKSDTGNDYVLSKIATQEDYWFHVKDFRGSSVILKVQKNTDDDIIKNAVKEASLYAAYYSQGRSATKIFVSCAKRKHVKKIKHAAGKVTFTNENTILVDVNQLEAKFHNQ